MSGVIGSPILPKSPAASAPTPSFSPASAPTAAPTPLSSPVSPPSFAAASHPAPSSLALAPPSPHEPDPPRTRGDCRTGQPARTPPTAVALGPPFQPGISRANARPESFIRRLAGSPVRVGTSLLKTLSFGRFRPATHSRSPAPGEAAGSDGVPALSGAGARAAKLSHGARRTAPDSATRPSLRA
jgi:hypothetical protein